MTESESEPTVESEATEAPETPSYDFPELSAEAKATVKSVKVGDNAPRVYQVDPRHLTIVRDKHHPLYNPSADSPPPSEFVRLMYDRGHLGGAIDVVKQAGHLMVEDGRQRVQAAQLASDKREKDGDPRGPVLVTVLVNRNDPVSSYVKTIALNNNRRDQSVLEKAKEIRHLMKLAKDSEAPMKLKDVALLYGKGVDTLRLWLKALEAVPEVQKARKEGLITDSDLIKIAERDPNKQLKALEELPKKDPTQPKKRRKSGSSPLAVPKRTPSKHRLTQVLDETTLPRVKVILRYVMGLEKNRKKVAKALGIKEDSALYEHLIPKKAEA